MTRSRYFDWPDHPLRRVPQECLDVARGVLAGAVVTKVVDEDHADPIADAVVQTLGMAGWLRPMACHETVIGVHCPTCGHGRRQHYRNECLQCRLDVARAREARLRIENGG